MVPPKLSIGQAKSNGVTVPLRKRISTRSQNLLVNNALLKQPLLNKDLRSKRKADASPLKEKTVKRSALGNITNVSVLYLIGIFLKYKLFYYSFFQAIGKPFGTQQQEPKKVVKKIATKTKTIIQINSNKVTEKIVPKPDTAVPKSKPIQRVKAIKHEEEKLKSNKTETVKCSLDSEKSEDSSLYWSALEDVSDNNIKKFERENNKVSVS